MMSAQTVLVKMAEISVVQDADGKSYTLKTTLGSCVGVILTDVKRGVHGLAHILLPRRLPCDPVIGKYADTAIPALVDEMEKRGCRRKDLKAYVVGGACMFEVFNANGHSNIGDKNVAAVKMVLESSSIPVVFEETGGSSGRAIAFNGIEGKVVVKTLAKIA
jgi:chemotaxis protein CheD